jgi:hypothetical protein
MEDTQAKEEQTIIEEKKEPLTIEQPKEENKEALTEQPVEAPKEELKAPVEVKPEEKEALNKEIKATKEELAVIKEVRDELVNLYARNKEIETAKEQLLKEVEQLRAESEKLASVQKVEYEKLVSDLKSVNAHISEKLNRYELAEREMIVKQRQEKLEKLSTKFKALGQDKSVEHLSMKSDDTIAEFEVIVDAALKAAGERMEAPSLLVPSQAAPVKESFNNVEAKKVAVAKLPVDKKMTQEQFFANLCKQMSGEQAKTAAHKVKLM